MTRKMILMLLALAFVTGCYGEVLLFDKEWRFHRGGKQGAEAMDFNDTSWRVLDLPHDWSIEDIPGTRSPFDSLAISQVSGGYTTGGTGWYRKSFTVPETYRGKKVYIQFDGIYMNSDVWLNGRHLGNHPYGYTSFWYDLTGQLIPGEVNVIAVQVKNEGQNSRWYSGSGIYRHVWLRVTDPVHFEQWGVRVTTPEVSPQEASVNIRASVKNESGTYANVRLVTTLIGPDGTTVLRISSSAGLEPGHNQTITCDTILKSPRLWSTESPVMYKAVTELLSNERPTDHQVTDFGIRSIAFSPAKGFLLNDSQLKLKGGCVHHDNGPLGARAFDRAEERRVELLKACGYNAIRCAHNPPSPAFLDACDRLGMLVIDEAFDMWRLGNNPYDYHLWFDEWWEKDIENMISRDFNHPSVIMWSIGNEIKEMENPDVIAVAKRLASRVRILDPSRPVTAAVNHLRPEKDPFFACLDICGYNYAASGDHGITNIYQFDHNRVQDRIMYGSESYPMAAFTSWMLVLDNDFVIGDFVWTAFDYIGEASIGWRGYWQENFYPWNLAYCGDIDICGWKRPQSFYRDVLWEKNKLSLFVTPPDPTFPLNPNKQEWSRWEWYDVASDWNWPGMEGKPMKVTVYSSCETVELFLNKRSLGKKNTARSTQYMAEWEVPYAPGIIEAVGYSGKKRVNAARLQTAGNVRAINLIPDRQVIKADGNDLCYVTVEMTDGNGFRNPKADALLNFSVEGNGSIVAVHNANPISTESFLLPHRKAWQGRCLVIIKSDGQAGDIRLTVSSEGLSDSNLVLRAE
ncbi:MAG TPA: glycoside hydrolase family 2 TIM barrel-domain containing protein [Bacteroidales bacterium]|nr:glycoside hydrolase family 2 TIM barrel-domain containing protein [Bacteroidales bacterium]